MPQYADTYVSHHGTAVASIIAGKTTGVSPNAELYTFDLFYHPNNPWDGIWIGDEVDDYGWTIEQSSVWYAKQLGVTVFNQSYGTPDGHIHPLMLNIWNANQDVLFVNAAGNNGKVVPPAAIGGNVILVGSVDKNNVRAPWSNIPGHANKYHFIMAPGVDVLAAAAFWPDGGYIHASGTSFSAPLVTGAVAELQDRYPQ
jgi:subtilisin family serine protease